MRSLGVHTTATLLALTLAGAASAQDELEINGLLSVGFAHAFQMTNLDVGGDLDDSLGIDVEAGFQAGEHVAFLIGYEWQTDKDFDTHYFPVTIRAYSPPLLERMRLYGTAGLGIFFTRLHNEFNRNDNERAAGFHAGGGASFDFNDDFSVLVYAKYMRGLGNADDFDSVVQGVALEYRWGL